MDLGAYSYQSSIVNLTRLKNAGQRQNVTHAHMNYIIQQLRVTVPKRLDSVTIDNIKNYFRRAKTICLPI